MAILGDILSLINLQQWLVPLLVVIILALWTRSRLERRPIIKTAKEMGFNYSESHDPSLLERFAELSILRQGHSLRAIDKIWKVTSTGPLTAFRLMVELGSRKSRRLQQYFVVVIEADTGIEKLRLGRNQEEIQQYDPTLQSIHKNDTERSSFLQTSTLDMPRISTDSLLAWVGTQSEDMCWQVSSHWVAGYGYYRTDTDFISRLIHSTKQIAAKLTQDR